MKTSEILNGAADAIRGRGWTQGGSLSASDDGPWGNGAGSDAPVCLEGGILAAMGIDLQGGLPDDDFTSCPAYLAVKDYLELEPTTLIFEWNDRVAETAEQVIEVLRAAAVIEEARENAEVLELVG